MSTAPNDCDAPFLDQDADPSSRSDAGRPRGAPIGGAERDLQRGLACILVAVALAPLLANVVAGLVSFGSLMLSPALPAGDVAARTYLVPRLIRIGADVALVFGVFRFTRGATRLLPSWSRAALRALVALASAASAAAAAIAIAGGLGASELPWAILTCVDLACIVPGACAAAFILRRLDRSRAAVCAIVVAFAAGVLLLADLSKLPSLATAGVDGIATSPLWANGRILAGVALWAALSTLVWLLRRSLTRATSIAG